MSASYPLIIQGNIPHRVRDHPGDTGYVPPPRLVQADDGEDDLRGSGFETHSDYVDSDL